MLLVCLFVYSHSTGTTHWLDPRLARYLKHSILDCGENGERVTLFALHIFSRHVQ